MVARYTHTHQHILVQTTTFAATLLGIAVMSAFDVQEREMQQEASQEAAAVVQSDLQRLQQADVVVA